MSKRSQSSVPRRQRRLPAALTGILQPGEIVINTAHVSAAIYWKTLAVFILSIFLLLTVFNLGIMMLVVTLCMFLTAWLTKRYLLFALTDRRVIIRYGVLQLETVQLHYNRIESVELAWTLVGRVFGYAGLVVTGVGSRVSMIPFVANAQTLRTELDTRMSLQDDRVVKVQQVAPDAAPAPTPKSDGPQI